MKKIILFFMLFLFISDAYSQVHSDSTSRANSPKAYFLQKSNNKKTGAWVLLIGGVAIFTATGLYESHHLDLNGPPHKNRGIVPIGLSIACIAGSIPLFIGARKNKLKAKKVTAYFKIEKIPVVQQKGISFHSYPAIAIKIGF